MRIGQGQFLLGDCFEHMVDIPDGSVDMVLCDLPYGTTQNKWDSAIPLKELWAEYWRVCKPNAAVVLTAQAPFDKMLGASQLAHLKYEWIWQKPKATGHLNVKIQPLKDHENVLVFYRKQATYNPQKTPGEPYKGCGGNSRTSTNYGDFGNVREGSADGSRYPRSVLRVPHVARPQHPTQKPVALFEYLIRTYTNHGDLVLDNTAGSGTTAVAAENTGRRWICIERDPEYYAKAVARAEEAAFCDLA